MQSQTCLYWCIMCTILDKYQFWVVEILWNYVYMQLCMCWPHCGASVTPSGRPRSTPCTASCSPARRRPPSPTTGSGSPWDSSLPSLLRYNHLIVGNIVWLIFFWKNENSLNPKLESFMMLIQGNFLKIWVFHIYIELDADFY